MINTLIKLICLASFLSTLNVSAQEVDVVQIPDKNLEQAIRDELELPDTIINITQTHMKSLTRLDAYARSITDVTGLEFAMNLRRIDLGDNFGLNDINPIENLTNLTWLSLGGTKIEDLAPLEKLTKLQTLYILSTPIADLEPLKMLTSLIVIDAGRCKISDVTPLATLTNLKDLQISDNLIEDITPISNLTQLIELNLSHNQIADVLPLASLTHLEKLWIEGNQITDHSPLDALSLTVFEYDQSCILPRLPIDERMQNRRFPSIFSAWGGIGWSSVLNLPEKSDLEQMALHDLYFSSLIFRQKFQDTPDGKRIVGEMSNAIALRDAYHRQNPNMLFIAEIRMRDDWVNSREEDFEYWLRDKHGEKIQGWGTTYLLDFTQLGMQQIIVDEAIAIAECGLYDGIFIDWWTEDGVILADGSDEGLWGANEESGYRGLEAEKNARDLIVKQIRDAVGDDFLILVNTNRNKIPRTGWAINGTFMETIRDIDEGYTHEGLKQIESTLSWAEDNLRQPQINCLEGWGIPTEAPDSPINKKWMRVFTTMSLTHSDGYVLYNDGIQHEHYWYDFWNTDLGKPIGDKVYLYENREGLFFREFTKGWAVYNRSGIEQNIEFSGFVRGVSSGDISKQHIISDLDGEMYLKTDVNADVNGDGDVNILD